MAMTRLEIWKNMWSRLRTGDAARRAWLTGNQGFSLPELIVSLQLFGVVALTAAPAVSSVLQSYYLRGAARTIYAELQKARMDSVMRNHRVRVVIVDNHTYQIHDDANGNGIEDTGETVLTRDIQKDNPRVQLAARAAITFAANGTAPTYGTVTLSNETGPSGSVAVVVSSAGRIRIRSLKKQEG